MLVNRKLKISLMHYLYTFIIYISRGVIKVINNERCVILARYLIQHKATVRQTAKAFALSKSTVHKDVTEKLKNTNIKLYYLVKDILNENFSVRHIRGGLATKHKYEEMKNAP